MNKKQLREFNKLKKQENIVISKSDKDGKIVILDKSDFIEICETNLKGFSEVTTESKDLDTILLETKNKIDKKVQELYKVGVIEDVELLATIGQYHKDGEFTKTRQYSNEFSHKDRYGHIYPVFKTHKNPDVKTYPGKVELLPNKILIRMVTSCTNAITSRASALLQYVYGDKIDQACESEFCKDMPSYLTTLQSVEYKKNLDLIQQNDQADDDRQLYIVALDVCGLYPNSPRSHVLESLRKNLISFFQPNQIKILIELTEICLSNTVVANNNRGYVVNDGILTGASNSTSLANSFLTTITRPVRTDTAMLLFMRFIDDIITHIYATKTVLEEILQRIENEFSKYDMKIECRIASFDSPQKEIEFLDVNHIFTSKNHYITTNFVKPTALGRTFLSGESFHPVHIYKGIIAGEALRLRRLNSTNEYYDLALDNLKEKCIRSNFDSNLVTSMIQKIKNNDLGQTEALRSKKRTDDKKMLIWASQVPQLRKVPDKYQKLIAGAQETKLTTIFTKPNNLHQSLPACRYRRILNPPKNTTTDGSVNGGTIGCGKCKLCGKYKAKRCMVQNTNSTLDSTNTRTLKIRQSLTCRDYGIYQLRCRQCIAEKRPITATYIGLTSNEFSKRFGTHRQNFKSNINADNSDKYALALHYKKCHHELERLPELEEAYDLVYLERPEMNKLKEAEDKWKHLSKATINIQKMITPNIH